MRVDNVTKVALFDLDGRMLLLKRAKDDYARPGKWDLPGGGIEAGESPLQAVLREASEEIHINLPAASLQLVYAVTRLSPAGDISVNRFVFVGAMPINATIQLSHEHEAFRWLVFEEAVRLYAHPVYVEALRYARVNKLLPKR
ncbi:MAG TPA: NUDIX hydrolase [Verrucomicrobiae bacterium]|nr:NUDIX hydrolase [Verrucomicrobiae bacterium]